jgi:hypothetical protein
MPTRDQFTGNRTEIPAPVNLHQPCHTRDSIEHIPAKYNVAIPMLDAAPLSRGCMTRARNPGVEPAAKEPGSVFGDHV